ncbi:ATP-grasp domain-containing protein [Stieleria varia]|uniref:ATP-grasp domain-containing protein n=1 Tax=Stieleria varia TaxID=2528005 RepID=UPI0011B4A7B3|nr:ATP-grasp domain-containing protein [Stieleria varia]
MAISSDHSNPLEDHLRIFVGEFVSGGGLSDHPISEIPSSLRREGVAMLQAIAGDIAEFAEAVVPLDGRLKISIPGVEVVKHDPAQPLWSQWIDAASKCDAALIVAPESDGMLAKGVAMLRAAGIDVIACSGDFLRVASDKLLTAKRLHAAGVAHPLYLATADTRYESQLLDFDRFVVKPRDGCGTQQIRTFDRYDDAVDALTDDGILQGWMPGRSISIALVASGRSQTYLPAVAQEITDESCHYAGGCGPLDDDAQRRATALASRAISAMPPTVRGFVGLDLILGKCPSEDCVIEINPRLTTSYVGLRWMIKGNLAARLFNREKGRVSCKRAVESVRWTPDGHVWLDDSVAQNA